MSDTAKLQAGLQIVFSLFTAGMKAFEVLKEKGTLSADDLEAVVAEQNAAQDKARAELAALLGKG